MNDSPEKSASVQAIAKLAKEAAGAEIAGLMWPEAPRGLPKDVPVAIVHGDRPKLESVGEIFEEFRLFPARKAGTAKVLTLDSLIDLTNRHKTPDTAIFANTDWRKPSIVVVIDYHAVEPDGDPAWLRHRIGYEFPLSDPWKEWLAKNGQPMKQGEFAEFIEDHIADLSSPTEAEADDYERLFSAKLATPAKLIELSRGLQVFAGVNVKNTVTLQSGESQVVFEEEHRDAAGNRLEVPGLFILQVNPFFQGDVARIPVRLRYRVADGKIFWFFQIYRPDLIITDRVRTDLDIIRAKTALPVFEGSPEV